MDENFLGGELNKAFVSLWEELQPVQLNDQPD